MSSYRFCRTDDIALLVEALNRCWHPYFPAEPPMTPGAFKGTIRGLQVWCSSCMVAFSGREPIGVLIGAKRSSGTLVHRIAVHPDHRRQGHGRHLLDSLGSKLAILGPPRIVAHVPEALAPACELFGASGFTEEARLTDYVSPAGADAPSARIDGRLVIPVTLDDLAANGALADGHAQVCWARSNEALAARKHELRGFAVATDERIEAYVLYTDDGEIMALQTLVDDGGARLCVLCAHVRGHGLETLRFSQVHPEEMASDVLATLGFHPAGAHRAFWRTVGAA